MIRAELPGQAVVALDLDDRRKWPGIKVESWDPAGRGWRCGVAAAPLAWKAVLLHIDSEPEGLTVAERQAIGRARRLIEEALCREG